LFFSKPFFVVNFSLSPSLSLSLSLSTIEQSRNRLPINHTFYSIHTLQGLDLRVEHTHCFSSHGHGGHYHYDVTPKGVKYVGYFTLAQKIYRIDPPNPEKITV
jgi:hypothetical protein